MSATIMPIPTNPERGNVVHQNSILSLDSNSMSGTPQNQVAGAVNMRTIKNSGNAMLISRHKSEKIRGRAKGAKSAALTKGVISDNLAERLSSAINVLGAECAARSTIRDKHVYSL